jgi:mono/diheme cytochrome c family protein
VNHVLMRWRNWSPVQRIFAALLVFLTFIFAACAVLATTELIANNLISTSENYPKNFQKPNEATLQRGAYLAKLGNCAACHTARGGAEFAGGKAIHTPFGAVYTSNITPDIATGLGRWSAEAFYRAMHEGISADGRLLTPAFPYTNYTHISRADSDDLYAYFMHSVSAVQQSNTAHDLPFPLGTQVALAVWRRMFFDKADAAEVYTHTTKNIANYPISTSENYAKNFQKPSTQDGEPSVAGGLKHSANIDRSAEIERGAYLVRGLGHCSACHAQRNALGATTRDPLLRDSPLSGGLMPMQDWYAPSLLDTAQAGVMRWRTADVVALLQTGVSPSATVAGPMAEVVSKSTQYWSSADLQATAAYLQSLPETAPADKGPVSTNPQFYARGEALYTQHCATCHGAAGQGAQLTDARQQTTVALPALAGNRAVTLHTSANLVRILLAGGYAPSTAGNPRPYGMPPFVHVLNDEDIAAVTTYIRGSWGNQAGAVSAADVVRHRKGLVR